MQFFRMRLILALIVGVTLVSVGSTYFEVLAHKHMLRRDLERRESPGQGKTRDQPETRGAEKGHPGIGQRRCDLPGDD